MSIASERIAGAREILSSVGLPRAQQNERSALCLLALLDLTPRKSWKQAKNPLLGITPIISWIRKHYRKAYAPNTRETVRRQTMHQFVAAGIALYNADAPNRPVNSPHAVYQIAPEALELCCMFHSQVWTSELQRYLVRRKTLSARYAKHRDQHLVPVRIARGKRIQLSPGSHSELIRKIIEEFVPRFVPGGALIYVGDTGEKWGYFDSVRLRRLGVTPDSHGKMPDIIIHDAKRRWLVLIESVTSHGPVDGKRHEELASVFAKSRIGLVYVTAFPNRGVLARNLPRIAWETEVWCADAPSHLIHFNGVRFLGPYADSV